MIKTCLTIFFIAVMTSTSITAFSPNKKFEIVYDPSTGEKYNQCINSGSNCDIGEED